MIWPPRELQDLERKLDELTKLVGTTNHTISEETRGWLARLLAVRACGYLEQVVVATFRGYVEAKSAGKVRMFASSWLSQSRNPSIANLLDYLGRFDGNFREEFDTLLQDDDQRLYRELSFLVDRRHKIAHGLNEGLTPVRALALSEIAREIADWFILRLNPTL